MVGMKNISTVQVNGKKVIVRCDLDVAMENGQIREDFRLKAMIPTLQYLLTNNAQVIIVGHLGRPEGVDSSFTLAPIVARLAELLGHDIIFIPSLDEATTLIEESWQKSPIVALENIRFDSKEETNDPSFARYLAGLGELFVNESFATAHREHASNVGIPAIIPGYAGIQFAKEIEILSQIRENPDRPLVMIMGGGKAETKVPLVAGMSKFADTILLGGKLMFAKELEGIKGVRFPLDAVRVDDIGPQSIAHFASYLEKANMIVWNGPVGRYEEMEYRAGTEALANLLAKSSAKTIIGGGDTIAALDMFGLLDTMDFVSTGGGSMLDFLAYGKLPAVDVLRTS